ncbi:MAG: phage tail tape measure protein, partial [Actinobacteria bacterium]|nr:phage tail tape measure protein [Actinomycetota bacterium]
MAGRELSVRITGDARSLQRSFGSAAKSSESFGRSLRSHLGSGLAVAARGSVLLAGAAGTGLVFGLKKALDVAGNFEKTLNIFQATSNATGRQMHQVSALAIQLGNDVRLPAVSAADAAVAMTELAKGGLSVRDAMKAAKGVLELSTAAQISTGDAAMYVATALSAFGLKGHEAVRVADLLTAASSA